MKRHKLLRTPLLLLLLMLTSLAGCDKVEDLIRFNFTDTAEIIIPVQNILPTGNMIKISTPAVQTSSQQAFEQNNTNVKYVKEAKLSALKLNIKAPENQTFSFLNEIKIFISAEGQQEVLIASKTNIPNTVGKEIDLVVTGVDLKPYIKGSSYNIRTEATVDEAPTQEIKIDALMTFNVTADVF